MDKPFASSAPNFYDLQVDHANPLRSWFHRQRLATIRRLVDRFHTDGLVLDICCGNALWNRDGRYHVLGVDRSKDALQYSADLGRVDAQLTWDIETEADIPLSPRSFGTVVMSEALEHTRNPDAVLMRLHRLMIPGGFFIISVPYDVPLSLWRPLFALQCAYEGRLRGDPYYRQKCGHIQHFSKQSLCEATWRAGFDEVLWLQMARLTQFLVVRRR